MMSDYRTQGSFADAQQPVLQGVNALFQDFGGRCRPLDLDFAAEDWLLGGGAGGTQDTSQENWHRNAALSNIAAQGAAIRGMVSNGEGGALQPAWKAWSASDDPRYDIEHSSGDSMPSTSYAPQHQQQAPKAESSSNPKLETTEKPKLSARQAAQRERERERAEKLKEKNKRAQRKFRQRQKDRQESAERMAMDLAEKLQKLQVEKEVLENRNKALENALGEEASKVKSPVGAEADKEPTFVPAKGWTVFDPKGGLVLMATCSPPRKLTHRQMLLLSLRDMATILIEVTWRLKECLSALELQSPNPVAEARIQALLWERHAIMAYMAVNKPKAVYQVLSCKMVDPPEPNCAQPPPTLWEEIVNTIDMTEQQKQNVLEARAIYIKKVGQALFERQQIRRELQELEIIPMTLDSFRVPTIHLKWTELVSRLKSNIDLCHRCNSYFMARIWYRDCFTPTQVARIITAAHPFPVDIFAIMKELVRQLGAPNYLELLKREFGEEQVSQANLPPDPHLEAWPALFVPEEAARAYRQTKDDEGSDPEVAKFSHRIPDDAAVQS